MQFGDYIGLLGALARYFVIFSHIGHVTMAAEAPDPPQKLINWKIGLPRIPNPCGFQGIWLIFVQWSIK